MGVEPMNTGFADQRVSHFATGAHLAEVGLVQCLANDTHPSIISLMRSPYAQVPRTAGTKSLPADPALRVLVARACKLRKPLKNAWQRALAAILMLPPGNFGVQRVLP
jgi:hypothetical protein